MPSLLTVNPLPATVALSGLTHTYDGTSKVPVAVSAPANLAGALAYAESITAPTNAGRHPVLVTTVIWRCSRRGRPAEGTE